jgi:uncharacterized surface protein with fasciclin (FAS1) repeats
LKNFNFIIQKTCFKNMKNFKKHTKIFGLLGMIALVTLTGCYERKRFPEPKVELRSIGALVSDLRQPQGARSFDPLFADFSTLKAAIQKLGLDDLLRDNSKNFIFFAPDNLAFDQLRFPFNNASNILNIRSRDNNGDPLQPGYNDSIMLRTIILNHVVEVVNNNEFDVNRQSTFGSVASQSSAFLPASSPLNTPWVNNIIRLEPAKGVQGSLSFTPPKVNGSLMFSWGTKATNGVLNTISNVLFPASVNDYLRVDGRYDAYAARVGEFTDLVGYLSDPNSNITLIAPFVASIPTSPNLRLRIESHILRPNLGRLQVSDFNTSRTIPKYFGNYTQGRNTGFIFVGSLGCLGASINVLRMISDEQPIPTPTITVGIGPTTYGAGCEAFDFTSFVSTSNGNVYHATGLLNPLP